MNGYGLICSEGERWNVQRRFTLDFMRKYGMSKLNQIQNSTLEEKIHNCLDILMEGMCLKRYLAPFHYELDFQKVIVHFRAKCFHDHRN